MKKISDPVELLTRFKNRNVQASQALRTAFGTWSDSQHVLTRSGLTVADMAARVQRYQECADLVELREYNGRNRVHSANYCSNPSICPICSRRVASRRRAQWYAPIREAAEMWQYAYLATFTVSAGNDLGDRYDLLKKSIRRFRRMGQKRNYGNSRGEWSKVGAAVVSDEVIRGKRSGKWHAHSHAILFCSEPLDYRIYETAEAREAKSPRFTIEYQGSVVPASKISSEWFAATCHEGMNIHLSPLEHVPNRTGKKEWSREKRLELSRLSRADSIAMQCTEVLKYATKITTLQGQDTLQVIDVLYNRRTITGNGRFHNLARYECPACSRRASALVIGPSCACPDCGEIMVRDNSTEYRESTTVPPDAMYEIKWLPSEKRYSNQVKIDSPIFQDPDILDYEDVRRRYQRAAAIMVGSYRSKRRKLLISLGNDRGEDAARCLDGLHGSLRHSLRELWDQYIILVKSLYPYVKKNCPRGTHEPAWCSVGQIVSLVCWDCGQETTNIRARHTRQCGCGGTIIHVAQFLPAESKA